jgi:hypothetical protein
MGGPRLKSQLRNQLSWLSFVTYQSVQTNVQGVWLMHNRTELSHIYFIQLKSDGVCVLSERKVTTDLFF